MILIIKFVDNRVSIAGPSQSPPIEPEILKDISHQHDILIDIHNRIRSSIGDIKHRFDCFLRRPNRSNRNGCIFDNLKEKLQIDNLIFQTCHVYVVITEIERYYCL